MQNLIFFGSDQYSEIVIKKLIESQKFAKITIVTDRAKPKDRDQIIEPNPVEKVATSHDIKVLYYPPNLAELNILIDTETVGLCTSFDHLVPTELIDLFRGELYNLHPSLLPQYRNVAPIQYAIALGDTITGITLFKITTGIDNGEIVGQVSEEIHENDTTPTLSTRLFAKGAELFLQSSELCNTTNDYKVPNFVPPHPLIFTRRLTRDSGYIEWNVLQKLLVNQRIDPGETNNTLLKLRLTSHPERSRGILHDLLRALTPWPGVWTIASTKKGNIRMNIESVTPELTVKLAGKPKAITWQEFTKYYL